MAISKVQTVTVDFSVQNGSVAVANRTLTTAQIGATSFLTGPTGPAGPTGPTGATGPSATDASTLTTGTLPAGRLPAFSGDVTTSAGSTVTSIASNVIVNADINTAANIDATKLGTGIVNNTEFNYLDGVTSAIQTQFSGKANTSHTHAESDITNLVTDLAGKQATLVSGTNIKTVNGTSLLGSGDLTVSGGGSATWGGITGTLSSQTDLQTALNAKAPLASPALTGTPTAPTASNGTNTTQIATTAYVQNAIVGFDDVLEYANLAGFPATGTTGMIYVADDTGYLYRWSGSAYVQVGGGTAADATTSSKGIVQLAGDLAGTAATPSVVKINGTLMSGLSTGILKNTTGTGVPSIAIASDFPTLNQSTTGSAATLTTGRTIGTLTGDVTTAGSTFNGAANNTNATVLATVNSNVGSFGSATQVPTYTVNAKGLTTAASNVTIQIPESQVTNLTTDLAGKQATLSLTTTGTSGAATLVGATLNIPQYTGGGGGSGITRSVASIATNTSAGSTASTDYVYNVTATSTLTLPTAVGNTNRYTVKNVGTGTVTVATTASQTMDGSTTASWSQQYASYDFVSDGSNWTVE